MEPLLGKIAAVTGGTRGIGMAIAERLLKEGATVAVCGRTQESVDRALPRLKSMGRVLGKAADVTDSAQVSRFFQAIDTAFGGMDVLVNNAGAAVFGKTAELTPEQWNRSIDLNLNAAFYCSREALERFRARGGGFIINISSLAGKNVYSGGAAYNAAKSGLNAFTEAMILDHRQEDVRVCAILPGSVDTESAGSASDRSGDRAWMIAPDDIAEVVALILRMPARTMVSRVEIRPSRPRK
jgi:3-oxoacyl-[acyl-carrier protein] reductase